MKTLKLFVGVLCCSLVLWPGYVKAQGNEVKVKPCVNQGDIEIMGVWNGTMQIKENIIQWQLKVTNKTMTSSDHQTAEIVQYDNCTNTGILRWKKNPAKPDLEGKFCKYVWKTDPGDTFQGTSTMVGKDSLEEALRCEEYFPMATLTRHSRSE